MKKLLAFILTFLYLGIATGFSTYRHFCMDRYVETSFWKKEANTCSVCGMARSSSAKKHCCKEEHKQIKLEKDHQASEYVLNTFQAPLSAIIGIPYTWESAPLVPNITTAYPVNHAPPKEVHPSLYTLNCTYLI